MNTLQKNLPHDKLGVTPIHLTYRLAGSLPRSILKDLQAKRIRKIENLEAELIDLPDWERERELKFQTGIINAHHEQAIDSALHAGNGSYHLSRPEIAKIRTGKFFTATWYVLNNPLKVGLVESGKEWPHTWPNPEYAESF